MSGLAWRLSIEESLPSTQTLVAERAEAGEPAGLAIMARLQTAGRGRAGRGWSNRPGNLAISILVRPEAEARAVGQFALLAAVALHQVAVSHAAVRLRWPNDLMLGEAKVAGILTEASLRPGGAIAHVIFGIGVNLAHAPAVEGRATACLGPIPPERFAWALLEALGQWLDRQAREGFVPIRAAWMAAGPAPGTPLSVRQGDSFIRGRYEGLTEAGALRLLTEEGPRSFHAGELGEV
ncbi:biotin--[acetyl-CoA-carboxylase] ligase [Roseococcus microcysteis]|uniref:biotin--[acetyl-CoA-carboxylase] ligase n=1 Tax=Roseococcus microcysteis TaxID=2771361 RepID=UPI001CC68C88|nr:biotin--[acetyl-CoA-carboxylase] ligase [Roseococcus microcysteis]